MSKNNTVPIMSQKEYLGLSLASEMCDRVQVQCNMLPNTGYSGVNVTCSLWLHMGTCESRNLVRCFADAYEEMYHGDPYAESPYLFVGESGCFTTLDMLYGVADSPVLRRGVELYLIRVWDIQPTDAERVSYYARWQVIPAARGMTLNDYHRQLLNEGTVNLPVRMRTPSSWIASDMYGDY